MLEDTKPVMKLRKFGKMDRPNLALLRHWRRRNKNSYIILHILYSLNISSIYLYICYLYLQVKKSRSTCVFDRWDFDMCTASCIRIIPTWNKILYCCLEFLPHFSDARTKFMTVLISWLLHSLFSQSSFTARMAHKYAAFKRSNLVL